MEWDDLRYVLAAARSRSFIGASKLLKVSHTTVGRRIKALERDLGKALFRRDREGCEPTEVALRLLPLAERVEAEMRDVGRLAAGASEQATGLVEVHTGTWILRRLLTPALPSFCTQHPKVRLHFVGDVVEPAPMRAVPVVSLRVSVMAGRGDIETALADFNYSVYGPHGKDPAPLPWATSYGGQVMLSPYKWLLGQDVEEDDVSLFVDDADLVAAAISTGNFKGLIPDIVGQSIPGTVRASESGPDLVCTMRAIVARHDAARPEVRAVMSWLEETIAAAALRQ
ncbi:MAG: LysR family transcriptional regulator [Hyphomicrobiaceae bacterium]|nr:LysR family transcriptional regulator [Hyphomicrobiaceae bacterium]